MNRPYNWTYYAWNCDRAQAWLSNSFYSGLTFSQAQQTKSKGTPSFISNSGLGASNMTWSTSPASGNPLKTTNYWQNEKYGNAITTKWTAGQTATEKGYLYEGEKYRKWLVIARKLFPV